jgi:hypothetical protein
LQSHINNQVRYIVDMAVIHAFDSKMAATRALVLSKVDLLVYHTGTPDAVEDIGLFVEEHDDYVQCFYGIGGSLHNFYS